MFRQAYLSWALKGTENSHRDEKVPTKFRKYVKRVERDNEGP